MRIFLIFLLLTILPSCSNNPHIDKSLKSYSQSERIKYIIIHYTFADLPSSLETLTKADVSSHYLITDGEKPFIYQLVDDSQQANHAGLSSWKIYNQLNSSSIGIEIVNLGFAQTDEARVWYPYPQAQIDQLILLLKKLVVKYKIKPENILGHNEVAPQRKQDPGPAFPWQQLVDAGLIPALDQTRINEHTAFYKIQLPNTLWFQQKLAQHGYAVPQTGELDSATRNVLVVFQSRYRQSLFDGMPDAETAAILEELTTRAIP